MQFADEDIFTQENVERARRVEGSLELYAREHDSGASTGEVLVDFLADMMHYAAQVDQSWDTLENSAMTHFMAEMEGE